MLVFRTAEEGSEIADALEQRRHFDEFVIFAAIWARALDQGKSVTVTEFVTEFIPPNSYWHRIHRHRIHVTEFTTEFTHRIHAV